MRQRTCQARAKCTAVIVVDGPDSEFTLDEFKVLQRAPSRPQSYSRAAEKSCMTNAASQNGHGPDGSPQWDKGRGTSPTSNRPSTFSSGTVGSTGGSQPPTYGRVVREEEHPMNGEASEVRNPFFKVPLPVVWVAAEDAAHVSEDCLVSIYWHDGLPTQGERHSMPNTTSLHGLATIQKRLQETDPDMHAKQLSALNLEMRAKDAALTDRNEENQRLQERLSSALRELNKAQKEHRFVLWDLYCAFDFSGVCASLPSPAYVSSLQKHLPLC